MSLKRRQYTKEVKQQVLHELQAWLPIDRSDKRLDARPFAILTLCRLFEGIVALYQIGDTAIRPGRQKEMMKTLGINLALLALTAILPMARASEGSPAANAATDPALLFQRKNLTAWCVVPFDANKRGPEERAAMLQRLGFKNFAYDWREKDIPAFDAEVEAMKRHGIKIVAWWFPTDPNDPVARTILEVCKRHKIQPQLWVMGGGAGVKSPEEQTQRIEQEAERIGRIVALAKAYGCAVELYNHNHWFGQTDNEIAIIERLKQKGVTGVGMIYNFSHGHGDIDDFPAKWKRMKPYVVAVNVTGMVKSEALIPPAQGEHELEMLRVIHKSKWKGPIGLIAEQGGDAEVTLSNGLIGIEWLRKELTRPGSGGTRPKISSTQPSVR
jgi:sugar phosphate isomerase/epimerase